MYRIFDILIESNIPFPELPEIEQGKSSISIQLLPDSYPDESQLKWYHHWRLPNGEISISCARSGDDYFLRFPLLADFLISQNGEQIFCFTMPHTLEETIRHLLVDQVIPRLIAHQSRIVLHASAIEIEGGLIAFLGQSGWGKSTLATSFYEQGLPLLTDDCLMIKLEADKIVGVPAYAGSRLWQDSMDALVSDKSSVHPVDQYSSKKRLIFSDARINKINSLPLKAIFVLVSPKESIGLKEIAVKPLKGAEMIMEMVKHSFYLDITDMNKTYIQFESLGKITNSSVPIYYLKYPRKHALLDKVKDVILNVLSQSFTKVS